MLYKDKIRRFRGFVPTVSFNIPESRITCLNRHIAVALSLVMADDIQVSNLTASGDRLTRHKRRGPSECCLYRLYRSRLSGFPVRDFPRDTAVSFDIGIGETHDAE